MNTKVLLTKAAFGVYAALAVLIAAAFGFQDTACGFAESFGVAVEMCVEAPVVAEE